MLVKRGSQQHIHAHESPRVWLFRVQGLGFRVYIGFCVLSNILTNAQYCNALSTSSVIELHGKVYIALACLLCLFCYDDYSVMMITVNIVMIILGRVSIRTHS